MTLEAVRARPHLAAAAGKAVGVTVCAHGVGGNGVCGQRQAEGTQRTGCTRPTHR